MSLRRAKTNKYNSHPYHIPLSTPIFRMASVAAKLSYHRLKHEINWCEEDEYEGLREKVIGRLRSSGCGSARFRKFHIKRKLRIKFPSPRRFFRRKARVVKKAWSKVYRRLKDSRSHFGDLFAGNYLFMQVAPTPIKCKEYRKRGLPSQDFCEGSACCDVV